MGLCSRALIHDRMMRPPIPGARWFIVWTGARREKIVARSLERHGIEHFVPVRRAIRTYAQQQCEVELPVFPRCVFANGNVESIRAADLTHSIQRVDEIANQDGVRDQLYHLWLALSRDVPLEDASQLAEGIRVEVCDGDLKGVQGLVEQLQQLRRLVFQIDGLAEGCSAQIGGLPLRTILG